MAQTKAERTLAASAQAKKIIELLTNDKPNGQEVMDFVSAIIASGGELFMLQAGLEKAEYDDALKVIGMDIGGELIANTTHFTDGSGIEVLVMATAPAGGEAPADPSTVQPG